MPIRAYARTGSLALRVEVRDESEIGLLSHLISEAYTCCYVLVNIYFRKSLGGRST